VVAATVPGTIVILDLSCRHDNVEDDPHKKVIEAGKMWDMASYESLLATGNDDGVVRLWCVETTYVHSRGPLFERLH
jgi:hypothetical protein